MSLAHESTDPFTPQARHLVVLSAGVSDPSSTKLLADRLADAAAGRLSELGLVPEVHHVELRRLTGAIGEAVVTFHRSPELQDALRQVEQADGIIAVSPTYKGSYSGLFKSFVDLVDEDALVDVPVLLGATGGTPRHSLMIDFALRPLFAYFKAAALPTSVFAAADDWGDVEGGQESRRTDPLDERIRRAAAALGERMADRRARRRLEPGDTGPVDVVPFAELLRGQGS